MQHLMTEYFMNVTSTKMGHIPYQGSAPAIVDVMAGNVRVLAVTSKKRSSYLPDVPTVMESGAPNYDATSWYGIFAPAKTPPHVVERLNLAINNAFKDKAFADKWVSLGADMGGGTPEELKKLTLDEVSRWAEVAKKANITVQ